MKKNHSFKRKQKVKKDNSLQAIIFAGDFQPKFSPISIEKPNWMFPVLNIELLQYTIDFLEMNDIHEIAIYTGTKNEKINHFIKKCKKCSGSRIQIKEFEGNNCSCLGDVLTYIDKSSDFLITRDFVLVSGNTISNFDLSHSISQFKKRKKKGIENVMTIVMQKKTPIHTNWSDNLIVGIDKETNQLVYYEKIPDKKLTLPVEKFKKYNDLTIHNNIIDPHIYICSFEILSLLEYDTRHWKDLIHTIMNNEETQRTKIHVSMIKNGYVGRIHDFSSYLNVSIDLMKRWCYPIVPEKNSLSLNTEYRHFRSSIYKENNVEIDRKAELPSNVLIGSQTSIQQNSRIINSVIGRNCKIGKFVDIKNSILWNGVEIGDNCVINNSLICQNALIESKSKIINCLISSDVKIDRGINLSNERITTIQDIKPYIQDLKEKMFDFEQQYGGEIRLEIRDKKNQIVGLNGYGNRFIFPEKKQTNLTKQENQEINQQANLELQPEVKFRQEIQNIISLLNQDSLPQNILVDVLSLKLAYNRTDTAKTVFYMILERAMKVSDSDLKVFLQEAESSFEKWEKPTYNNLNFWQQFCSTNENQLDIIYSIEYFLIANPQFSNVFVHLLKMIYDQEIVEENVILQWFESEIDQQEEEKEKFQEFKKQSEVFINWLKEALEESESDEDDEDESNESNESNENENENDNENENENDNENENENENENDEKK
ncbi:translation initiation factor eif-2b subunit epsilon [Anaeramoeba ignava]|uniref:Translation initiation factor eIF2B subunit epsilon n=1 Tax=Anaeramoeba ignava TaxID=1746090 RepID=A0A9Q0LS04_ANAIG|nr:translation initiation factor eif-2b subunit epsilon [Anaeramoeba ignava]